MPAPTQLAVYETFEDVFGTRSTLDELIADVRLFSQQSVLWVCATIVTGLQLWNKPDLQRFDIYLRFLSLFFDNTLRARLVAGYWSNDPKRFLFHRRQVLLISKLAILHCSGHGLDARFNPQPFGRILLKANDQLHYGLLPAEPTPRIAERDDYAKIITEMVAVGEHTTPNILHMVTRSHLMLTQFLGELRDDPDFVDVACEYQKATGLTIEEFEAMIVGVHARFGEELVNKLLVEPGSLPLRDANFNGTAIPPEKVRRFLDSLAATPPRMQEELSEKDNGPNDFTIFRKFPLVQQYYNMHLNTASCGFLMMDNLFFLEKIQTGPYWNANESFGLKLRKFWVFSFRMISDTRLECQDASEAWQTASFWAIEEAGSGVKPGGGGTALLDGFLSSDRECSPDLPPLRDRAADLLSLASALRSHGFEQPGIGSHRPRRCRRPTWSFLLEDKVLGLRLQYPRWGKDKLVVRLQREKLRVSTSMVGRIVSHLKRQGRLVEAPRSGVPGSRRALRVRPYAVRKPKQYAASGPGDLVEVDTMDVRPVPGMVFKQFTARDVVSRWDVVQAHSRATAHSATEFLDTLTHRMPFPIRALQVDGGSEFAAEFEQACQQRGLHLFVLPPRSPKLNGAVERANRTHTEEFYQVTPYSLELRKLNRELRHWERTYNTVRPHQALGYLTSSPISATVLIPTKGMKVSPIYWTSTKT